METINNLWPNWRSISSPAFALLCAMRPTAHVFLLQDMRRLRDTFVHLNCKYQGFANTQPNPVYIFFGYESSCERLTRHLNVHFSATQTWMVWFTECFSNHSLWMNATKSAHSANDPGIWLRKNFRFWDRLMVAHWWPSNDCNLKSHLMGYSLKGSSSKAWQTVTDRSGPTIFY